MAWISPDDDDDDDGDGDDGDPGDDNDVDDDDDDDGESPIWEEDWISKTLLLKFRGGNFLRVIIIIAINYWVINDLLLYKL